MPFVALLLPPVVGPALAGHWRAARAEHDSRTRVAAWKALLIFAFIAAGSLGRSVINGDGLSVLTPNQSGYPSGGVAYASEYLAGRHIYNDYNWGGYIIESGYPEVQVFIDGRTDFYRKRLMDDYATIGQLKPGWREKIDQYGIDAMLLNSQSRLADALRKDASWQEVYTGPGETILVRR